MVKRFVSGTVPNAVPFKAECVLHCSDEEVKKLQAASKKLDVAFDITPTEGGCQIVSHGQAAHASTPWNGVNAASYLVELLSHVFGKEQLGTFFGFIHEKIGLATDGSQIGVQMSDEPSGPLTFNLGLVNVDEKQCSLTVDIRYPATKKGSRCHRGLEGTGGVLRGGVRAPLRRGAPCTCPRKASW